MNAQELTQALGGRWHGSYGQVRCPAHDDRSPSLTLREGEQAVLIHCHAGCEQAAVIDALKARGLWKDGAGIEPFLQQPAKPPKARTVSHNDEAARRDCAFRIWSEAQRAEGSPVEIYLRSRSITIPPALSLRWHHGTKYGPSGLLLPAMIAAFQAPDRRICAIQRTYLKVAGGEVRKAPVSSPKMTLGPVSSGAVRLGPAGRVLGLAEGVESGLSAMQLTGLTCWCRCGSSLDRVWLPEDVVEVQIFADGDDPGRMAAERARDAFEQQGRRVFVRTPPAPHRDWNDVLQARGGVV